MARATIRKKGYWLTLLGVAAVGLIALPLLAAPAEPTVRLNNAFSSAGSGVGESSLGDLVADAMRTATGAQVALLDSEALREMDLPKGVVKVSQFQNALSDARDPLAIITLSGKVLARALDRSVSNLPQPSPGFLQVAGVTFDVNAAGSGRPHASGVRVDGKPLDMGAQYSVAVTRALARGTNGYFLVWPASTPSRDIGQTLGGALTAYLNAHPTITPTSGRIVG
ncbi:MAG TPA: 5'-nucleotidase [Armatimonadota bacterium]|nr:5'-nucleotidase [Armatimonadota bacterium]